MAFLKADKLFRHEKSMNCQNYNILYANNNIDMSREVSVGDVLSVEDVKCRYKHLRGVLKVFVENVIKDAGNANVVQFVMDWCSVSVS